MATLSFVERSFRNERRVADIRYPYCLRDGQFRLMTMAAGGLYRCKTCGHEVVSRGACFQVRLSKGSGWLKLFLIRCQIKSFKLAGRIESAIRVAQRV